MVKYFRHYLGHSTTFLLMNTQYCTEVVTKALIIDCDLSVFTVNKFDTLMLIKDKHQVLHGVGN